MDSAPDARVGSKRIVRPGIDTLPPSRLPPAQPAPAAVLAHVDARKAVLLDRVRARKDRISGGLKVSSRVERFVVPLICAGDGGWKGAGMRYMGECGEGYEGEKDKGCFRKHGCCSAGGSVSTAEVNLGLGFRS
jgi:hypothetical protein